MGRLPVVVSVARVSAVTVPQILSVAVAWAVVEPLWTWPKALRVSVTHRSAPTLTEAGRVEPSARTKVRPAIRRLPVVVSVARVSAVTVPQILTVAVALAVV